MSVTGGRGFAYGGGGGRQTPPEPEKRPVRILTRSDTRLLITARNEVGARLCFTGVCDSVHRGGGVTDQVPPPPDQVHTPPDQVHTPLGPGTPPQYQVHPPNTRYTPPDQVPPRTRYTPLDQGDTVYARAVRILLECNLFLLKV